MNNGTKASLRLLDDLPIAPGEDRFKHQVFAETLREVFEANPRHGISVGLFGKWGSGKSTIVNLLKAQPPQQTKMVVFNAWHAQGDSVRRQMLLALVEVLSPAEATKLKEFFGISVECHPEHAATTAAHCTWRDFYKDITSDWTVKWSIFLGLVILAVSVSCFIAAFKVDKPDPLLAMATSLFLPAIIPFIAYLWSKLGSKYFLRVNTGQQGSESLRFQYPEQFHDEFVKQVSAFLENNTNYSRVLLVIDDLDRCDAKTVTEALAAIRQFAHTSNGDCCCQFLLPCDDKQVVLALESDGGFCNHTETAYTYHNYHDELLRKFFDVVVRMDQFLPQDLVAHAQQLVNSGVIDIDTEHAKQLIGIVQPRDPRQVKKLLNALRLTIEKVNRFCALGLLPPLSEMTDFYETLLLLVALRETTPTIYDAICNQPEALDDFETLEIDDTSERKRAIDIRSRCGYVSPVTANLLIACRWDARLTGLKAGPVFFKAVGDGDETSFKNILKQAGTEERQRLLEFFIDHIRTTTRTAPQLRKSIILLGGYGLLGGEHEEHARRVLEECVECPGLRMRFPAALEAHIRLDWIARQLAFLSICARNRLFEFVLQNYLKEPKTRALELGFLLQAPLLMTDETRSLFCAAFEAYLKGLKDSEWQAEIDRIAKLLPNDQEHCSGFLPNIIPWLVTHKWTDDVNKDLSSWATPKIARSFIGNNSIKAKEILEAIFGSAGKLQQPQRLQSADGARPLWVFVSHLMSIVESDFAPVIFPRLHQWLTAQQSEAEARFIIDAMSKQLLAYTDPQFKEYAHNIIEVIRRQPDQVWLLDYLPSCPQDTALQARWGALTKTFFSKFKEFAVQDGGFPDWYQRFLAKVTAEIWPIHADADVLLGYKIRNQQAADKWFNHLASFIQNDCPQTKKDILVRIKADPNSGLAFRFGILLWGAKMDMNEEEETAREIANYLERAPASFFANSRGDLANFVNTPVAQRALGFGVALLKEDEAWLQSKASFVLLLAEQSTLLGDEQVSNLKRKANLLLAKPDKPMQELGGKILSALGLSGKGQNQ